MHKFYLSSLLNSIVAICLTCTTIYPVFPDSNTTVYTCMKNFSLSVIIGILFSAIGTASLFLTREALTAAIWLSFGNGLILSNLRFKSVDEAGNVVVPPVPKVRLYVGLGLIVLAVLLLIFQVYLDMSQQ